MTVASGPRIQSLRREVACRGRHRMPSKLKSFENSSAVAQVCGRPRQRNLMYSRKRSTAIHMSEYLGSAILIETTADNPSRRSSPDSPLLASLSSLALAA